MSDREAFEAWARDVNLCGHGELTFDDTRNCYFSYRIEFAWQAWQAARKEALLNAAEVCDQKAAAIWAADADEVPGYAELVFCAAAIRAMAEGKGE